MSGQGSPARKNALLVAYGGGHASMLIPLYRRMEASGLFNLTFLGLTTAGPSLARAGIPYIGFKDLVEPGDEPALAHGKRLAAELPRVHGEISSEETIAYLGLSYYDLVQRLGEAAAERVYRKEGRYGFMPLGPIGRLFEKLRPALVITTNSPRAEKAAIWIARKQGIPSLCIVDLFALPDILYIGNPGYADRVCVFSEQTRKILMDAGRDAADIVVTGNPAFDRWADPALPEKARALRLKNGWQDKKVLLWASQPEPAPNVDLPRQVDRELFRILAQHPEWHLVLRPHPSETVKYDVLPPNMSLSGGSDDLSALLAASDLVITFNSTLGLEGVLIGKRLVTVDLSVQCKFLPYSHMGIATGVNRLEDLEKGILQAFAQTPESRVSLPAPGNAAERVFEVALELVGA